MDAELKQYLIAMEERIVSYVNERCELVETKLLTEFHRWASPAEARSRTIAAALRAIDLEMESIADRVKKLEAVRPSKRLLESPSSSGVALKTSGLG